MVRPPHTSSSETKDPSGAKQAPVGFLSWFKNLNRLWHRNKRAIVASRVKRDIDRLERERAREHTALLRQRRFYERLIHPRKASPELPKKTEVPLPIANPKELFKEPLTRSIPQPVAETEKVIPEKPAEHDKSFESMFAPKIKIPAPMPTSSDVVSVSSQPTPEKTEQPSPALGIASFFKKIRLAMSHGSLAKKLASERQEEEAAKHKNEVEERFWQPYNGVKANLIKDQGVLFFNWQQRLLTLALALILCSLAIGLVYVGLLIWQKERLNDNQSTLANFEAINAEIAKNEKDLEEIVAFNRKLDVVSFILSNHVYWTNFFNFLENNTLKDVYFDNFSGDLTGKYTIAATARNLEAVSSQLEVMKAHALVRNIEYSSGQTIPATEDQPAKTKFNLELSVDPKLFLK
jgi:hypothetical protein